MTINNISFSQLNWPEFSPGTRHKCILIDKKWTHHYGSRPSTYTICLLDFRDLRKFMVYISLKSYLRTKRVDGRTPRMSQTLGQGWGAAEGSVVLGLEDQDPGTVTTKDWRKYISHFQRRRYTFD